MKPLRPFFGYFGGKWRLAKHYPAPKHGLIIEPFAGSAGYALRYSERDVLLVERNPVIAALWQYLLSVEPERVRALGDVPEDWWLSEERALAGMWWAKAPTAPRRSPSSWARNPKYVGSSWWGAKIRERIATQIPRIRHWRLIEGSYADVPNIQATWFVDPPYERAGRAYPCGSQHIDYAHLASWCRARSGQVLVCEAADATWLPFQTLPGNQARLQKSSTHREALWRKESDNRNEDQSPICL